MGAALLFLKANPRLLLAGAALAVLLGLLAYERHQGAESVRAADRKAVAKAEAQVARHEAKADAITDTSKQRLADALARIDTLTAELKAKVPTHVTAQDDAGCRIPDGFVSLYNAGARGSAAGLPEAAGGPDVGSPGRQAAPR